MADNPDDRPPGKVIGALLIRQGLITPADFAAAIARVGRTGGSLMAALEEMGIADEAALVKLFAQHYGVQTLDIETIEPPDEEVLRLLPREYCERHRVLPIARIGKALVVAFADPGNVVLSDEIGAITHLKVEVVVASARAIKATCQRCYAALEKTDLRTTLEADVRELDEGDTALKEGEEVDARALEESAAAAPVVRIVSALITDAIVRGVSDIHIERYEKDCRVRFRIDGVLQEVMALPPSQSSAIVSRIKVLSRLNIAERRMPQDGRMKYTLKSGRECDFRVSIVPFQFGEKVVMRLLDKATLQTDMTLLGFDPDQLAKFQYAIHQPHGIVLVTGPTGSGKTTTLYSALSELNKVTDNILTAEDPIEFVMRGINQLEMDAAIGRDFAGTLRAFLRQDPDIIMVGEIRDFETAEIAVKASLTGHVVLSTLHTNDAPSTISRLKDMGVELFLLADALNMIIAQRLVRCTCVNCRRPQVYDKAACLAAGMTETEYAAATTMRGSGCTHCNGSGLKGRVALYEVLPITDTLRQVIVDGGSAADLKRAGIAEGMQTLRRAGLKKFGEGVTTLEEVLRITRAD
ncbi:MAG: Flp pilus assembly complex ATPase component TadA [Candidatus Magasanikbacteria bacterium]|nr:Flp pilus assembly complex ATPase component TadA [Candidatus Magasanikbacteria bacterium]